MMRKGLPNFVQAAQARRQTCQLRKTHASWAANPPSRKQMQIILKTCTLDQTGLPNAKRDLPRARNPEVERIHTPRPPAHANAPRAPAQSLSPSLASVCVSLDILSAQERRAHPDLNQGPADLQSAALATELCTHGCVARGKGYALQCAFSSLPARLRCPFDKIAPKEARTPDLEVNSLTL